MNGADVSWLVEESLTLASILMAAIMGVHLAYRLAKYKEQERRYNEHEMSKEALDALERLSENQNMIAEELSKGTRVKPEPKIQYPPGVGYLYGRGTSSPIFLPGDTDKDGNIENARAWVNRGTNTHGVTKYVSRLNEQLENQQQFIDEIDAEWRKLGEQLEKDLKSPAREHLTTNMENYLKTPPPSLDYDKLTEAVVAKLQESFPRPAPPGS